MKRLLEANANPNCAQFSREIKLHFNTKINVCTFAYMEIILYLCNTKEKEILS